MSKSRTKKGETGVKYITPIYTIEYSNPSSDNYDFDSNPNWIIFDKDFNALSLLQRFVGDVNSDDINMNYYWRINQIKDNNG